MDSSHLLHLVTFDNIDGVPIHYARHPVASYGTKGKGPRKVRLVPGFLGELERCLDELWKTCPYGKAEVLVSGGFYVEKAGRHGEGRAVDIDAIWWAGQKPLITKNAPLDAIRYLGVEAVLRKYLGMVLDYWYNQAHEDHWHCDDGTAVGWRGSRNQVLFMQAALKHVYSQSIGKGDIDGIMGKDTAGAFAKVMLTSDIQANWIAFLDKTAKASFAKWVP